MSKLERIEKAIEKMRAEGKEPSKILMSRTFAIKLKSELMPNINQYFIDGRMTISGVPWEISNVSGFRGYLLKYFPRSE